MKYTPPRYDDVYYEGLERLDADAAGLICVDCGCVVQEHYAYNLSADKSGNVIASELCQGCFNK